MKKELIIYLVIDTYDQTYSHNIDAAFLREEDATAYKEARNYSWHRIEPLQVSSLTKDSLKTFEGI